MTATSSEVGDAVLFASRALMAIAVRSLAAVADDVTIQQYRSLVLLAGRGPLRVADLADELAVASSSATRMCDRLVRKELVRREEHAGNRRELWISLTPQGREIVDRVTRARRREIDRVVRKIDPDRRQALIEGLEDLGRAAGEIPDASWSTGLGL